MGRGETRVSDSEGVRREKVKGREKKWENLPWERRRQKIMFPTTIKEYNIYRRCNEWERNCFANFFFGKQPIKNKSYFYKTFPLIKDSFPYHRAPLVRWSLHKYKYLWSVGGKDWSSNLQKGVSHTYTLRLP